MSQADLHQIENMTYRITMPDDSKWDIAMVAIAYHQARNYAESTGEDTETVLHERVLPAMLRNPDTAAEWAKNNMDWDEVKDVATLVTNPSVDFQYGWVNGEYEIL